MLAGLLLAVAASAQVQAGITAKPDLSLGEWYGIVFVTAGTTKVTGSSVATYDAFVGAQANLNAELAPYVNYFLALAMAYDSSNMPADVYPYYNTLGQHLNWTPNPYTWGTYLADPDETNLLNPLIYDQVGVAIHPLGSPVGTGINSTHSLRLTLGHPFVILGVEVGRWVRSRSKPLTVAGTGLLRSFTRCMQSATSWGPRSHAGTIDAGSVELRYRHFVGTRLLRRRDAISSKTLIDRPKGSSSP